jgi:hypothetical protein
MFSGVSSRERMLIAGAAALLSIFLIYQLVYTPLLRKRDEYTGEKLELENTFGSYTILAERYLSRKSSYDGYKALLLRKKSLSVLTYLENEAQAAGIRDNIEYIRPKGSEERNGLTASSVEMKIDAMSAGDLFSFLESIEKNRNGLIISYLRLKPFYRERDKVDVIVRVTDILVE